VLQTILPFSVVQTMYVKAKKSRRSLLDIFDETDDASDEEMVLLNTVSDFTEVKLQGCKLFV